VIVAESEATVHAPGVANVTPAAVFCGTFWGLSSGKS
jgi:hypothetical protein